MATYFDGGLGFRDLAYPSASTGYLIHYGGSPVIAYGRGLMKTANAGASWRTYEEAVVSGVEFVSPEAIWTGHEPCGASGQYTNSVKPYLNFPNPVNGGSFHPNAAGQQTLAALTACYLNANRQAPDPFAPGAPHVHTIPDRLVTPAQLHMAPAPGLSSVPGSGQIPLCHG